MISLKPLLFSFGVPAIVLPLVSRLGLPCSDIPGLACECTYSINVTQNDSLCTVEFSSTCTGPLPAQSHCSTVTVVICARHSPVETCGKCGGEKFGPKDGLSWGDVDGCEDLEVKPG